MTDSIFDFDDYRSYLERTFASRDGKGRGFRSYLAEQIKCQRTFISQVLRGDAHFNLEHGESISRVLGHTDEEANFFLLLILYARAGTPQLRERLRSQIESTRERRLILKNRFHEDDPLSLEDKTEYYSSWLYGAIRVLLTIPGYQSRSRIEQYFKLPKGQISTALDFLISRGLLSEADGKLQTTTKHLYIGNDSRLVSKHHTNWRIRAIQSLDHENKTDLHFSAVNSLSRQDVLKIRETLAQTLEKIRETVRVSPEECLYTLCIDFFEP